MFRIALGFLMAFHGIAHAVGFVVPWRLVAPESAEYSTTILAGRIDLGSVGIRALGLVWLVLALGFVIAALAAWLRFSWWMGAATWLASVSLVLSALGWPASKIGVPVNLAILAAILIGHRVGVF